MTTIVLLETSDPSTTHRHHSPSCCPASDLHPVPGLGSTSTALLPRPTSPSRSCCCVPTYQAIIRCYPVARALLCYQATCLRPVAALRPPDTFRRSVPRPRSTPAVVFLHMVKPEGIPPTVVLCPGVGLRTVAASGLRPTAGVRV